MHKIHFSLAAVLSLVCINLLPPAVIASPATSPSTSPATQRVEPVIGFGDVASKGGALRITLREMNADISSDNNTNSIEEQLAILSQEIDSRLNETTSLLQSSPSLQELPRLEADWQAF